MSEKIALVTGGNRGIGLGIVQGLLDEGMTVIMGSRSKASGEKQKDSLSKTEKLHILELDVSDEQSIINAAISVRDQFGKLDVLVNNAGIIGKRKKSFPEGDIEEIREILETNYFGPMQMNAQFLEMLRKGNDARIINVSSGMGSLDDLVGGYAGYRLSKAGLNSQTVLLANELRGEDIRVFAMCPGWVRTDMGGAGASRSVEEGADTAIYLAISDEPESGKFYRNRKVIPW